MRKLQAKPFRAALILATLLTGIARAETPAPADLAQEELAQLLGASRQRVNQELKTMEREDIIRIEPGGLVVRNGAALRRISEAED